MDWRSFFYGCGFILILFLYVPIRVNKKHASHHNFSVYMERYNKSYSNDTVYHHRYKNFMDASRAVDKLNKMRQHNSSAIYGLSKFSDMSKDEFKDQYLQDDLPQRISGHKLNTFKGDSSEEVDVVRRRVNRRRHKRGTVTTAKSIPLKVDWRESGVVTKINNQKSCGACWAFSTIQNMESMYAIKYQKLLKLSVQQAIDCARYSNQGCDGGDDCTFLEWLHDYKVKVYSEEVYPLHLKTEVCKIANDSFYVQVDAFDCDSFIDQEEYILQAIATIGPVAVAVNAISWQYYLGGVIQFNCGGDFDLLNHSVQLVGYDLTAEIPHYIARNSWGEDFGDKGYLYLAMGDNLCGLANEVSAMTVL
ncbi:hypothetical protein RN001_003864 [Aquatica leii]|uniref:Cathepsin O n=1 Tax=Aquatica leii TaxID=1421715 RepID=A0AAN7SRR0_9COLE|nr:hypothetical protein RN001_003864 [Aquatica leii]